MAEQTLAFGPFRLDPAGVLWRDGKPLSVGRRGVRLLEILLRHRGQVVRRADLMDAAWPGEAVEESNLSVQIAQLRKRVGGNWIRNVERVGYQLVQEEPPALGQLTPSLGIRAFRNMGGADEIAETLTDNFTTALSQFASFRVLTPHAGFGAADYVLEGSVRSEEGRLHIGVRLAEQRSGHYRWADRFEAASRHHPVDLVASIVDGQIELAEIAAAGRERPGSQAAPDLYRRARLHMRTALPADYAAATALLQGALALDPNNVRYLAGICEALSHHVTMGWQPLTNSDTDLLFESASLGLRQPTSDAEALGMFGVSIFRTEDPVWGYNLLQQAAELNPHSTTIISYAGNAAMHWGTLEDAEAYFRRGLALDPLSPSYGSMVGGIARIRMIEGRFEEALSWADRAYGANPFYGGTQWTLIAANALLGRAEVAGSFLDRYRVDHPGVTIESIKAGQPSRARLSSTLEGLDRAGLSSSG